MSTCKALDFREQLFERRVTIQSRADRNRINRKVMKDPRLAPMMDPKSMPFDMKRMAYGGFRAIVDL